MTKKPLIFAATVAATALLAGCGGGSDSSSRDQIRAVGSSTVYPFAKVVADFRAALPEAVIYVYDNNSTDRTVEVARAAGAVVRREMHQVQNDPNAVFFSHPRESISYHYERNPADPRIAHALTLEVDEFGNVLKSAAVGYGPSREVPSCRRAGNYHGDTEPRLEPAR